MHTNYLIPFGINLLWVDGCVGVGAGHIHMIGLNNFGNLTMDAQDGYAFLVSLWQGGLELIMGCTQPLRHTTNKQK